MPAPSEPEVPRPRRSIWKQILITLVCGVVLALGSCFGFLDTLDFGGGRSKSGGTVYLVGFGIGLLLVGSSILGAFVAVIIALFRAARSDQ
jgi:hypothetical protein